MVNYKYLSVLTSNSKFPKMMKKPLPYHFFKAIWKTLRPLPGEMNFAQISLAW
jgi:hypothetical protein